MSEKARRIRLTVVVGVCVATIVAGVGGFAGAAIATGAGSDHGAAAGAQGSLAPAAGDLVGQVEEGNVSGTANLTQRIYTEQRGDIANITIELSDTDRTTLRIGSDEVNYVANLTVEDGNGDGTVTVQWNTYAAASVQELGIGAQEPLVFDMAADEDNLTVQNVTTAVVGGPEGSMLEAAEYPLEVGSASNETDPQDFALVDLQPRSTNSLSVLTAPDARTGELDAAADVDRLMENGNITRAEQVAIGDLAAFRINASGVGGAIEAQRGSTTTEKFLNLLRTEQVSLDVERITADQNVQPAHWRLTGERVTSVVANRSNDTYYVLVDTEQVTAVTESNGTQRATISDGDRWEANFTVAESALADRQQTVSGNFTTIAPEINVSEEPYTVNATAQETIRGTTTLAPGSVLAVRVRSTGDTQPRILTNQTAVVTPERTWSAEFNFSGQSSGGTFEIVVSGGAAQPVVFEGRVAEA